MKAISTVLILLLMGGLVGCQSAEAKRNKEFAQSWEKWSTVELEVVAYEPGTPDAFLATSWGSFCAQIYPSNLAKVKVLPPSEFAGEEYTISIPDDPVPGFDPASWREPGRKHRVTLSLVYLKYRPWGFIPFDAIRVPGQRLQRDTSGGSLSNQEPAAARG